MPISRIVLALYIFLEVAPVFGWFATPPRLQAIIGILYVLAVLLDAFLHYRPQLPDRFRRRSD